MALENHRPIQFPEKTEIDNTDVVLIDSQTNGTNKYQLSRITAEVDAKVAAAVAAEAEAREAADEALQDDIDTRATSAELAAEKAAREQDVDALKEDFSASVSNVARSSSNENDFLIRIPFTFSHGQITSGQIVHDVTYRAVSSAVTFDGYDYIDFVMQDKTYHYAVYYYDDDTGRWYQPPYNTNSFIDAGRFRVFDDTKRYVVYIGFTDGSTALIPIDAITEAVKIEGGYFNSVANKDAVIEACNDGVMSYNYSPIPFFVGRVDGAGYSNNRGEVVSSPFMITGYDSIVVTNTNPLYRFAIYSVDSDGYHMHSGGWVNNSLELDGEKNYIIRVGRTNSSTAILSQAEFDAIISSITVTFKTAVTITVETVSQAERYLAGKKISISGDSRSTFNGTQPSGYPYYYPKASAGLTLRTQTWWQRVIDHYGMTFLANAAWSGGITGIKSGFDALSSMCADERVAALSDGSSNPDIIIVYTGVNDWINNIPIGSYDGTGDFPSSYDTFSAAVAIMIKKIQVAYPNADLWLMANSYSNPESTATTAPDMAIPKISTRMLYQYNDKMAELCKKMCVTGFINLEYCGVNHMNIQTYATDYPGSTRIHGLHYNAQGHKKIADYIITEFEKYYNRT